MPPTFVLVRHGEAEHNVGFRQHGESAYKDPVYKDSSLTQLGMQQANEANLNLSHISFVDVWSSPLSRCIETASRLSGGRKFYLHDSLLERLGGGHICNERKTKSEIRNTFPRWSTDYLPENPPRWEERESIESVRSRMLGFISYLREFYKHLSETNHILIVSHHDAIESLTGVSLRNADHIIVR